MAHNDRLQASNVAACGVGCVPRLCLMVALKQLEAGQVPTQVRHLIAGICLQLLAWNWWHARHPMSSCPAAFIHEGVVLVFQPLPAGFLQGTMSGMHLLVSDLSQGLPALRWRVGLQQLLKRLPGAG